MHKIPILISLLLASSLAAQPVMTLEDAIALGLKNNYDIQMARQDARIADNNRGLGRAGFLPTVDAAAGLSRSDSEQDADPPGSITNTDADVLSAEVSLNWTIFDGFKMFAERRRYSELAELGENQARGQIENAVVAISRAYYDLVRQEQLLAVALETRNISETRLNRERTRNQVGGASSTDVLNAQVAYNADQSSLLAQELQVDVARQQFNVVLGQDPATPVTVSTEISIPEVTAAYDDILEQALDRNAGLRVAEFGSSIARSSVKSARASFMPKVVGYAKYGYTDQTVNADAGQYPNADVLTQTTSGTIGLSLSLNLFNGVRDRISLQNAKIEANNSALAERDARNRLIATVLEAYQTYNQRMEVVALEEQNIRAAEQSLDLQRERNALGVASSLEFRDAQISYAQARTSLITARYQARIARLELDQLMGVIATE